jgi:hypothetical protein
MTKTLRWRFNIGKGKKVDLRTSMIVDGWVPSGLYLELPNFVPMADLRVYVETNQGMDEQEGACKGMES